jgi:hypothetical protein
MTAKKQDEPATLDVWRALETTEPRYVKAITGRQYNGSSPNPTYIAKRLTQVFGPATIGWGTQIVSEEYREFLTPDDHNYVLLHTVRLRLWTRDAANPEAPVASVEQCGTTKMAYWTAARQNKPARLMIDDDGPKKSVTDAFVKCASLLGAAGDIFLGRWDDSKYQADLAAQFGTAEQPVEPGAPPPRRGTALSGTKDPLDEKLERPAANGGLAGF